jgi:CspA family cold shock protein
MKLIVKIIISVAVAAVAAAITTWYAGDGHAAPVLFIAFCCATVATALLVSIPGSREAAPAPRKSAQKSPRASRPAAAAAKSTPRDTATDGVREHGLVKWFNVSKGFGFITKDDGEEIFVHFRSIRGGGRRGLRDGQQVTFVVADSDKGPQAEDVEGLD